MLVLVVVVGVGGAQGLHLGLLALLHNLNETDVFYSNFFVSWEVNQIIVPLLFDAPEPLGSPSS